MIAARLVPWLACVGLLGASVLTPSTAAPGDRPALRPLVEAVEKALADGDVVAAQLVVGDRTSFLLDRSWGRLAPGSSDKVHEDTQFCIGSCSKPVAAACVLVLVDQGKLELDARIGKWLPGFRNLEVEGGMRAKRAPTVRELLAHRGGIYSQKDRLTPEQRAAIRDYTLTLEKSAQIISRQKLLSQPGSKYAYSGAGYCVLGRVAEVAAESPFETIFQQTLGRPLRLKRTTYFPVPQEKNVALGGRKVDGQIKDDPQAPHRRGAAHRLPLVGGGLYSTAREMGLFARMFLQEGRVGRKQVLSAAAWRDSTRRPYADQDYGLGWGLKGGGPKQRAQSLNHSGALASYRSVIHIDLASGHFLVAHWTLPDGSRETAERLGGPLNKAWQAVIARWRK